MELKSLVEVLKHFAKFHNHQLDEFAITIWTSTLNSFDLYDIKKAFLDFARNYQYFPKPAQVMKWLNENKRVVCRPGNDPRDYRENEFYERQYSDALSRGNLSWGDGGSEAWEDIKRLRRLMDNDYLRFINQK